MIQINHDIIAQRAATLLTVNELIRERRRIHAELERINELLNARLREQPELRRDEHPEH